MSTINKHQVMKNWVQQFLDSNYLYFESADSYPGVRVMLPNYGDYVEKTDILGAKYKSYTFAFIGYETVDPGTSDVNLNNQQIMDDFNLWLEEQIENKNYPNFGSKCSDYEIIPLQNMANLAAITEDGLAKYMLLCKIKYKEE